MTDVPTAVAKPRWLRVERSSAADVWFLAEFLGAVGICLGFTYALLRSGGRDPQVAVAAIALTLPALFASRVWRRVAPLEAALVVALVGTAVLVPWVTPLGMSDGRVEVVYLYAPVAYLAVRAFARDSTRRRILFSGFLVCGLVELLKIWPVWIGSDDVTTRLAGTFYWHNQFGIYMAALAAAAAVLLTRATGPERWLAWALAPAMVAMTVLSRSRGSELALVVALLVLGAGLLRWRDFRGLVKIGIVLALAVAVIELMFLAVGGAQGHPSLTSVPGASDESFGGNAGYRWQFWVAAVKMFGDSPLTGHGYGSFGVLAGDYLPDGAGWSRWAHSGPLQALTDGGLLLGLPVLVAMGAAIWVVGKRLLSTVNRSSEASDASQWAAALGSLVLLAHTWIDFDWQYPTLLASLAILLALTMDPHVAAVPRAEAAEAAPPVARRRSTLRPSVATLLLLAPALAVGIALNSSYWDADRALTTAMSQHQQGDDADAIALMTRDLRAGHLRDPRAAVWLVGAAHDGLNVPPNVVREALARSKDYASVDEDFAQIWRSVDRASRR